MIDSARNIDTALRESVLTWTSLLDQWNDSARQYFEDEFMRPILSETPVLVAQMKELSRVFDEAQMAIK